MPTFFRGFRFVAIGFILVWLDLKIGGLDILPDALGYALMAVGLAGAARFHPAFGIATVIAVVLCLFELTFDSFLPPASTPPQGLGGIPPLNNEPFRVTWSPRSSIAWMLETGFDIALLSGLHVLFAKGGDIANSDLALRRRYHFMYIALLLPVAALSALAVPWLGIYLLFPLVLSQFVLTISLIRLLGRAARPPRDDELLAQLVAPGRTHQRRFFDFWRYTSAVGRWLMVGAVGGYLFAFWWFLVPCSPVDTFLRISGCVKLLDEHEGLMTGFAFAPDNRSIATNSDGRVRFIDLSTDHTIYEWGATRATFAHHVAVAPDGRTIAATRHDGIQVWRPGSLSVHVDLDTDGEWNGMIAFAPDGTSFAAADDDGVVYIWRTEDGAVLHRLEGLSLRPSVLQFSTRGTLVAATEEQIAEWRVDDGTLVHMLDLPNFTWPLAIDTEGMNFALAGNGAIELRSIRSGELVRRFDNTNGDSGATLAFSQDGAYLAVWYGEYFGPDKDQIRLFRASTGEQTGKLVVPGSSTYGVRYIQFSPDNRLLAASGVGSGQGGSNVAVWRVP